MSSSTVRIILVAASVLAAPLSARADATASADLTDLTIRLIDLNPSDGITPWVRFPTGRSIDAVAANMPTALTEALHSPSHESVVNVAQQPFGTVTSSSAVPGATAFASFDGDPQSSGSNIHASASATGGSFENVFRATGDAMMSYYFGPGAFVLSPGSELVMTATATTQAATTTIQGDGRQDQGYAAAFIQVSGTVDDRSLDADSISSRADPFDSLPGSVSGNGQLSVSFSNASTASVDGYYFAFVTTLAQSGTVPIPPPISEPATLDLLLAGIGILVSRRLRRPGLSGRLPRFAGSRPAA